MKEKIKLQLSIYFGLPGSGKTTLAAAIAHKRYKQGRTVFANFPLKGAYILSVTDLGKYQIENATIIIDEAGICFNNRKYKLLEQSVIEWLKYHRHAHCDVHVFSQSYDDMDITLRRLASQLYYIQRSAIPLHFCYKKIHKLITVDAETKQIVDGYELDHPLIALFTTKRIFGPFYWKYFDSYSMPQYEYKEFDMWGEINEKENNSIFDRITHCINSFYLCLRSRIDAIRTANR